MGTGYLTVKASMANEVYPIEGAVVEIQDANRNTLYTLTTDASGKTRRVKLSAPDKETTLDENYSGIPYSTYIVKVTYPGFVTEIIEGVQIFDTVEALQLVDMHPALESENSEHITVIPPNVQVAGGQPQQEGPPESEPISALSGLQQPQVMIPETITVHLGSYTNASARNVVVPFPLYIKNVASSEIYPTWPEASLEANIRAIINFALNRVYTEWYRIRGYNFDITSTTATDMYFVEGRDIFVNIGVKVDQIIGEYLRRPNHIEPFFTSFCDGKVSQCSGLLQWGTVTLANNGYSPMQIIHYYYPKDLFIDTAPIGPIVESFPGVSLSQGVQGPDVELMQRYLNRIRQNYPLIPYISNPNGIFGTDTANSVRVFQQVFSLPQTGVIDRATWNKISYLYVAITKLADLKSEGDRIVTSNIPPSTVISLGVSGGLVARLQYILNYISQFYPEIPTLIRDGAFGSGTRNAVIAFQERFGLTPDGVVGPATWNKLYEVYFGVEDVIPNPPAYITHVVQPGDTLFQLAQQFGTTVAAIMELNNLTSDILTIGQVLRIPSEGTGEPEPPISYITHIVEAGDTLWALAQRFETTVEAIRLLNNLTSDILEIGQELRIPTEETELPVTYFTYVVQAGDTLWQLAQRFGTTVEAIRLINNLTTDVLNIGQELRIPSDGTVPPAAYFNHTVQPGDTLWSLAQRFGTTVDILRALNNLTTDQLDIGQVLRIPSEGGVEPAPPSYFTYIVQAGDTLWAIAQRYGTTVDAIIELNNLTSDVLEIGQELRIPSEGTGEPEPPSTSFTHVVQAGDTLWALAQRFGVTVADIKALNNLTSDVLEIGQVLQIPSSSSPSPSTIVLDAGHGGSDPGAVNGSRLEKNDNLNMARAVQQRLLALGQNVIMTRDTDVFIPLEERSAISNRNNADFFISFHRNASSNSAANGLENYVQIGSAPIDIAYAQNVQDEVFGAGVQSNGGVREGNYSVTRNTNAPAMLLELGYITNTVDNQLFDQNFNAYADAITRGIMRSLTEPFPPAAPSPYFNYIVQSGDTLFSIASKFGTTVQAIVALNNLTSNSVALRQILRIPN